MMGRFAIIEGGVVTNVVLWDGVAECDAIPANAIRLPDYSPVGPGYSSDGTNFSPPLLDELGNIVQHSV